jgi:hypothetical protein
LLDGDLSGTYWTIQPSGTSNATVTFSPKLPAGTTIEIYGWKNGSISSGAVEVNGTDVSSIVADNFPGVWADVSSAASGGIETIKIYRQDGTVNMTLSGIRVDGTVLINATPAANDSLVDSPTSYGTPDTGVGGEVRGNYCTWNPLFANSAFSISNGNLDLTTSSVYNTICASTFGLSSGKWYWEITINSGAGAGIGVCTSAVNLANFLGGTSASRSYDWTGQKYPGGASYGASYTVGDIIGVAIDVDAGTLVYYKNGVSQGTAFTDLAGSTWFPAIGDQGAGADIAISANFGQRPFAYTL